MTEESVQDVNYMERQRTMIGGSKSRRSSSYSSESSAKVVGDTEDYLLFAVLFCLLTFEVLTYLRLTDRINLRWLPILIPLIIATLMFSYYTYKAYITKIANPCTKWTIILMKGFTTKFIFGSFILRALYEYYPYS